MPSNYDGDSANVATNGPLNIASTTNSNPITVTVSGSLPTDFLTGCEVDIVGHQVNTIANGQWRATVTGASTFTIPQAGIAAGGATGTVQPLNLTSLFTIPSDGDNDNQASIFPSLSTLGDRIQWIAARTGAYKMVSSLIIGLVNDPACVTYGINAVVASTLTDTPFGGGIGGGAVDPGHPFAIPGVVSGDLIRVSLTASSSNLWPGIAQFNLFQIGYVPGTLPVGGIGSYSKITGAGLMIPSINQPISSKCQFIAGASGNVGILPALRTPTVTGTFQMWGDFMCTAEIWRPSGMPQ